MMPAPERRKSTYEEYSALPEGTPCQLIGGEFVMSPAPTPYHQIISDNLHHLLGQFVRAHRLGRVIAAPIDVLFTEYDVYQPDLIFIATDRLSTIGDRRIEGAPDLVVEILSPSTAAYDLWDKRLVYEASGVREYWIVDPSRRMIEIYRNVDGRFMRFDGGREKGGLSSSLLPGLEVNPEEIF